jgi:hypothetical protein
MKYSTKGLLTALAIMLMAASSAPALAYSLSGDKILGEGTYGTLSESLSVGKSLSVGLQSDNTDSWYLARNSNPKVAKAKVANNYLEITALAEGLATIKPCSFIARKCLNVSINAAKSPAASGDVLGASTFKNGQLIYSNNTVYIIYKNTKANFANTKILAALGFSAGNITQADVSDMPDTGYTVNTTKDTHPWGSWVIDGKNKYFVHELGLIPVNNDILFWNNGGSEDMLVKANAYDLKLPKLLELRLNDPRLK